MSTRETLLIQRTPPSVGIEAYSAQDGSGMPTRGYPCIYSGIPCRAPMLIITFGTEQQWRMYEMDLPALPPCLVVRTAPALHISPGSSTKACGLSTVHITSTFNYSGDQETTKRRLYHTKGLPTNSPSEHNRQTHGGHHCKKNQLYY